MGPQFVHIQCYSIKPNRDGNSIDQVLGEAMREPLYSIHVDNPEPPTLIAGCSLERLRELHSTMLDRAATSVMVKGRERMRAIRKDRKTLMTVVASFPSPTAELDADLTGETGRKYDRWKALTVAFLKKEYGDQLKSVVEHTDEKYPHIHAYVLPDEDPGCYAFDLHLGEVAKKEAAARAQSESLDKKEITKIANVAYRSAMIGFQSAYYHEVGGPSGLTRSGPKRRRLTRAEWQAEQADAKDKSALIDMIVNDQKAVEEGVRNLRHQSDVLDDAEDDLDIERADIARDRKKIDEDRLQLNVERARFKNQISVVRDRVRSIIDAVAEKFRISLPEKISEALNEIDDVIDSMPSTEEEDGPDLTVTSL